jgi:uncharacterized membrane protein YjfL (UPF0719 family)
MDTQTLLFTGYELSLAVLFSLVTIYVVLKVLHYTFLRSKEKDLLVETNPAIALFAGTIVICSLMLVSTSVLPAVNALRTMVLSNGQFTWEMLGISLGYFLVFFALALILNLLVLFAAISIYMAVTVHVDELREIRANNVAVALMMASVMLGMTLFIRPPMERFIGGLVQYEALERFSLPEEEAEDGMFVPLPPPSLESSF